ncbi:MAG: methyltransferase domain-containing protein [Clostridiales bacterium]|nr:methyltransferase domain-containing protein [Clostridiales bacterium]
MENKDVFRTIIDDYAAARPGYPPELYRDIVEFAALREGAKILEIGAGPGQATEYFVQNRYDLTALEISEEQVRFLKSRFSRHQNFHCACSAFEDYACAGETYDLIFSATAFHWIGPEVGYPKAYYLLRQNGVMAVFWHLASIVAPGTEMLRHVRDIYRVYAPELDDYISREEAQELPLHRIAQMQTGGLFQTPVSRVYRWNDEYDTARYLKLMNSYSDFHAVSREARTAILGNAAAYIDDNGGRIMIPQEVRLYMAKK